MAPFHSCHRILWAAQENFTCRVRSTPDSWSAVTAVARLDHTRGTSRISARCRSQPRGSLLCHHLSWRSWKAHTRSSRCILSRTEWRACRESQMLTKLTSNTTKWVALRRRKFRMTTTRHSSTTSRTIIRSPKATFRQWARSRHMKKKCARLSTK